MKYFNLHQLNSALALTYMNALCGVSGIIAVSLGFIDVAFIMLIAAALFDVFDGAVARLKKQTMSQKRLGTVADSVADMVSFGVLPVTLFISICSLSWVTGIVAIVYVLAAIHRLVVFTGDALQAEVPTRQFIGLPVLMGAIALPIGQVLFGRFGWFESFLTLFVLVVAILFVSKIAISKPHGPVAYAGYLLIAVSITTGIILW